MKSIRVCVGLMLASVCASVLADGTGTFYNEGKAMQMPNAYAYQTESRFDKGKSVTHVVFSAHEIDAAKANAATDRESALRDQLQGADFIEINISSDGSVENVNSRIGDSMGSQSGIGWYTLELKQNDAKRIEGTFRSNDEEDKASGRFYDFTFAFDLPGAVDLGAALPAGGGDAGKAYMAYTKALAKGDIDALAATMIKSRADQLLAGRNDPDFKKMFGFIQSMAIQNPKYVKGNSSGDTATLEYSGKDTDGNAMTTTVTMQRENGAWKLAKESSQNGS